MTIKLLKTKFYAVNPYKRTIKKKPYKRAKDIDWKYRSDTLTKVYIGKKGEDIKKLIKKGFKVEK